MPGVFRNKIKNWSFKKQQFLMYGITLGVILLFSFVILFWVLWGSISKRTDTILDSDCMRISSNFNNLVDTTNQLSKMIMFDSNIQEMLTEINGKSSIQGANPLRTIIGSTDISSIYLYDFHGFEYALEDNIVKRSRTSKSLTQAAWYQDVLDAKGGYRLYKNAGGFLQDRRPNEGYLSMIRTVNNLDTQQPIGILIINIYGRSVTGAYEAVLERYSMGMKIYDDAETLIYEKIPEGTDGVVWRKEAIDRNTLKGSSSLEKRVYHTENTDLDGGWGVKLYFNKTDLLKEYTGILAAVIVILFLAVFSLVIMSSWLSDLIRYPARQILKSMELVKQNIYEPVEPVETNLEMNILQDGYNHMVEETKELLDETVRIQKQKRKYELDVLQAQIRPHFLYNTFDAISALALMERSQDVFIMMQALGKYYRNSLHKGAEIIPLEDELKIIENYLIIMKYRFENIFEVDYDIDKKVLNVPILKLVMQPFVENAIFHGLKNRIEGGRILISVREDEKDVLIHITDNGVGMSEEDRQKMLEGKLTRDSSGFGVHSTIERLRLYYEREDVIQITSEIGKGTDIFMRITKPDKEDEEC